MKDHKVEVEDVDLEEEVGGAGNVAPLHPFTPVRLEETSLRH